MIATDATINIYLHAAVTSPQTSFLLIVAVTTSL